ncbi:AT-rich interactive domain-containing protein 5B [Cheilinus undulatus]|uniref:AT-rich interactive domain-containing protein 5B n=1 Tax=Cheilinus undulatus TaxID=241271 RepID=UPI001BD1DF81|nr:AT-rich interactive domain-containing protein 5B [Cheilinus undulatus]
MEHNAIQWLGAPSCQRGSYAFYKSVSSRAQPDGPVQVWRLGEFYFIRCGPQDPVCIAEVTLLWEDQTQRHLLASARLYFLPEDTPNGRTREHGEDEVLAVSRKMVLRVEDLVRWTCMEPAGWSKNVKPQMALCGMNGVHKPLQSNDGLNNNTSNTINEPLRDKTDNEQSDCHAVKVLSYPQYCRFRSLQRRIQDRARGEGLQDPHLMALGGVKASASTRLMYCRDTFNHPTLESNASFTWQFRCPSLSLRGRPRKRKGRDGKDSPTSSQTESWIDRMKENVMGSVETGCEGGWLPHPEEQLFLDQLFSFMSRSGSPIHKVPNLGFKKIDLFLMYSVVKRLGGHKKVTNERLWKVVYNELGGCPGSTSAATCTRRHYERLLLPYEEHLRAGGGGAEFKIPDLPLPQKPKGIRGRKPLPRGRKPGPKPKEKKIITPTPPRTIVTPNGTVVVKRGRGRPPGTRNKSTLIAQAKLLAQQQAKAKGAAESLQQSPLLPSRAAAGGGGGGGRAVGSSTHRPIQPVVLPPNMPLTPELSPMSAPFLPFPPKLKELKMERGESAAPGVLLSTLPRHFVGGALGGFSPIKGVCPLDVFRNRLSLQRGPESPALTPQDPTQHLPTIFTLQPKTGSPDTPHPSGEQLQPQPHPLHSQHTRCSGCSTDDGVQKGGGREARTRHPLPPLRVLPLNLDCSVQVCQLMRTRLGSTQFQTFTRRLSEALSQDVSAKPPCSPITPPPEQALPLNLSKRFPTKRTSTDAPEQNPAGVNGTTEQPMSKRARLEQNQDFSSSAGGASGAGVKGEQEVETKNQEEPADLSSPSRIRAFLLGLPPFQVKLEEDLNGAGPKFGKFLPSGSRAEPTWTETEHGEGVNKEVKEEEEEEVAKEESDPTPCSAPAPAEVRSSGPSNTDTHCF